MILHGKVILSPRQQTQKKSIECLSVRAQVYSCTDTSLRDVFSEWKVSFYFMSYFMSIWPQLFNKTKEKMYLQQQALVNIRKIQSPSMVWRTRMLSFSDFCQKDMWKGAPITVANWREVLPQKPREGFHPARVSLPQGNIKMSQDVSFEQYPSPNFNIKHSCVLNLIFQAINFALTICKIFQKQVFLWETVFSKTVLKFTWVSRATSWFQLSKILIFSSGQAWFHW